MTNMVSGLYKDGRSFPSRAQMLAAVEVYDHHAARLGDVPNAIADLVGWSRGTAAVIRRWSAERAAGEEMQVEVRAG